MAYSDEMKDPTTARALDESTKNIPPGWRPGIRKYPFRRYKQLLLLWQQQTDVPEKQQGAAIVSRLKGPAFQFAMSLSQSRYDWTTHREVVLNCPDFLNYDAENEAPAAPKGEAGAQEARAREEKMQRSALMDRINALKEEARDENRRQSVAVCDCAAGRRADAAPHSPERPGALAAEATLPLLMRGEALPGLLRGVLPTAKEASVKPRRTLW